MSNYSYTKWSSWKIMPIFDVYFVFENGNAHKFETLLDGSDVQVQPVQVKNDWGGNTTTAFKLTGQFLVAQDNYSDLNTFFQDCLSQKCEQITIGLAHGESNVPNAGWMHINNAQNRTLYPVDYEMYDINWSINAKGVSPLLTINILAYFSIDILYNNKENSLFNQEWITQGAPYNV